MKPKPLYVGIDLGTSNSTASVFDGETVALVRNSQGAFLTPSLVRVDARKTVTTGARARRYLEADPENTRGEFKRLMGVDHAQAFPASGVSMTPVQLSAEILRSLRQDIAQQFGVAPERAVVSVPALFELHQTAATAEAARLAGFERIELIQEPIASAIAAGWTLTDSDGAWMVYDLGGGTFDVSLLETRDGMLRVVGHDGDNFLGGRDFDRVLAELALADLQAKGLRFDPADLRVQPAMRRLRAAAEETKIELSRADRTSMFLPGLDLGETPVDVDVAIERADYEAQIAPLIDRSIAICLRLLAAHSIAPGLLERIVLVGGPTMTPFLRRRLAEAFVAPIAAALDPMTLVSQGAALFAGTLALDGRPADEAAQAKAGPKVWLQYPAVTADLTPFVVGKLSDGAKDLKSVEIERDGGSWKSGPVTIEADGAFAAMVALTARRSAEFVVFGEAGGGRIELARFKIMHGGALGEPPLSRSVGVALADGGVQVFFARGAPLPIRRTYSLRTVDAVSPGAGDYALKVPIVQGEFRRAEQCRLVGTLEIPASRLPAGLPAGSEIELMLELDRSGELHVRARVVKFDLVFDEVAILVTPRLAVESMDDALAKLRARAEELSRSAFQERKGETAKGLSALSLRLNGLARNIGAARSGDLDAGEQARREISECDAELAEIEAGLALPTLKSAIESDYASAVAVLAGYGDETERATLSAAHRACEQALAAKDMDEAHRQHGIIRRLWGAVHFRKPGAWADALELCAARVADSLDIRRSTQLVAEGREAAKRGDQVRLERIVRDLWGIEPPDQRDRAGGHGSGLRSQ